METREWKFTDKAAWPRGEWDDEPDKKQWADPATGLPCLIHRAPSGALCGYVGVAEGHPFYGKEYHCCLTHGAWDFDTCDYDTCRRISVDVHGGLTFSDFCHPTREDGRGICHVPAEGEPDKVWWFGFDCAHHGDRCPAYEVLTSFFDGWYKGARYVEQECTSLAAQLAKVQP